MFYSSFSKLFNVKVKDELIRQPPSGEEMLTPSDIAHLPFPVRKYLNYTNAIGKRKTQNMRIGFDAKMIRKQGAAPMSAKSVQYNFYDSFSRLFLMKACILCIPFHAMHIYTDRQATFRVRVVNLFNVVDLKGDELTTAETVTLLNDMCLFAPGNLHDKRLSWKELDPLSCQVTLENGLYKVSAILYFNDIGELINFVSDDRSALQDNGTLRKARWSTPVRNYRDFEGRKIPTYGETIWNYPEGDFTYGIFNLTGIAYNI